MSKIDFTLCEGKAHGVTSFMVSNVPDFESSEEYMLLDTEDKRLAYLVCGAFGAYALRVFKEGKIHLVERIFKVINDLGEVGDSEVDDLLAVGVFEGMELSCQPELVSMLRGRSKSVYNKWLTLG